MAVALLAACDTEPRPDPERTDVVGSSADMAEATFRKYGCVACHIIPGITGARGRAGPPLREWAGRRFIAGEVPNRPETLVQFIRNPQSFRPGTAMPNLNVTEEDARNMAAYLYELR